MTSDYTVAVPGSIGRENSKPVNGIDSKVIYVLAIWAFISLMFLFPVLLGIVSGIIALTFFIFFLGWWAFFYIYLRDAKHIEKLSLFLSYLLRTRRAENIIAKYTQPLKYIADSYPVKDIHECGLIEYYGPTTPWGVLINVDPFKVGDDELESHQAQLTEVFNSLPENVKLSVINTSYVDESQQFITTVRDRANDPILTKPQKEHLTQIHHELVNDAAVIVDWTILISLIFNDAETLVEAQVKTGEYVPGILNGLRDAGLNCFVITEKTEIITQYRKMMEAQICC